MIYIKSPSQLFGKQLLDIWKQTVRTGKLLLTILSVLNLVIANTGEKDISGLTDTTVPRVETTKSQPDPKAFNLSKENDVLQHAVRKPLNKEDDMPRVEAPNSSICYSPCSVTQMLTYCSEETTR